MKILTVVSTSALLMAMACSNVSRARDEAGQACSGTSDQAIVKLPHPLSEWGTIVCTPYGHIISNHEGWYWSKPGAYSPVFIPSQMVRSNPEAIGNASYFTKIDLTKVDLNDPEAASALVEIQKGYSPETPIGAYRLYVQGSLGRSLVLYFFDWGKSLNGIWCDKDGKQCNADTAFMLLSPSLGS